MKIKNVLYLPSGRIFIAELDNYIIEFTEMRDVSVSGKNHYEVRETNNPKLVWKHLVDFKDKWLLTVSTQKGCPHNCNFCDVAPLEFKGNLTTEQILKQIEMIIYCTPYVEQSNKVKIGFARMGEPAHNLDNVLRAVHSLPELSKNCGVDYDWLPCFNTILPNKTIQGYSADKVIGDVIDMKEIHFNGFLHFQLSINSTDEEKRKELLGGADVMPLDKIVKHINNYRITNRTVTLNFIVMDGVEIDIQKLKKMGISKEKFSVKLIPLNKTNQADNFNLKTYANYSNYEKLEELKLEFEKNNIPVVIDAIAKCEEAGLCCGQLAQIYQ